MYKIRQLRQNSSQLRSPHLQNIMLRIRNGTPAQVQAVRGCAHQLHACRLRWRRHLQVPQIFTANLRQEIIKKKKHKINFKMSKQKKR